MLKTTLGVVIFAILTMLTASTAQRGCQDATKSMTTLAYYPIRDMRRTVAITPQKVSLRAPDSMSVPMQGIEMPPIVGGKPLAGLDLTNYYADHLMNPVASDDSSIARGERKFMRTCVPCHGPELKGNGPVAAK